MSMIHVVTSQDIERHRLALIAWAEANGLDPNLMDPAGLTIEQVGDRTVILYSEHQLSQDGKKLVDPDHPGRTLVIRRSRTLRHALPEGIGRRLCTCTLGEVDPGCPDHPADTEGDRTLGG
ncbi:hypothetical protein [Actinacidiphila sp. ITFR-21]|uniref:hypothetical protein n=1 Tax=Actinacidiphila sp. ITFR-21 TaxID=3075199 RepID=UPI00288955D9|nr:hypothetical protein [Streptomyces sp. ITFR-21]WNI16626.1 hypothetical protein RLT57_14640 [Streptomyces sp. ITFR-21]